MKFSEMTHAEKCLNEAIRCDASAASEPGKREAGFWREAAAAWRRAANALEQDRIEEICRADKIANGAGYESDRAAEDRSYDRWVDGY